jgi:hypothetical protein
MEFLLFKVSGKFLTLIFYFTITILYSSISFGASAQYGLGFGLHYFSGQEGESLAPDTGTVIKFAAGEGRGEIFRWWTSLSLLIASSDAIFTASSNASAIDYSLKGGEFQLGMKIVPLASQIKIPVQPYMSVNAVVQSNSFTFDETATVASTFPFSDSQMFYGYNITVGSDLIMSKKWGFFIEVEQSVVSGTLGGSSFATGGNRILIGIFSY